MTVCIDTMSCALIITMSCGSSAIVHDQHGVAVAIVHGELLYACNCIDKLIINTVVQCHVPVSIPVVPTSTLNIKVL